MERSQMQSLVEAVQVVHEARTVVLKGIKAFAKDESMLDDLENDLQGAGLKPTKDYVLDQKKGTLTLQNKGAMKNRKIDNIKRIYRLKEEAEVVEEQKQLDEKVSLMAKAAVNDVMISSKKIENAFEELSMQLSASMKESISEFIAEYLEEHIDDAEDLKIVLDYMKENPDAVEETIQDTLNFKGISGMINLARVAKEIGPDMAESIVKEIQRDAKFKKYVDDVKDLGSAVSGFVKGLFKWKHLKIT